MSQKTRARKNRQQNKNVRKVAPYKEPKQIILENVVMSDTIKTMPVLIHDITEKLKDEVRLKHGKKRHVNLYVPEVNELEQPTGKLVKLKCDITPWGIFVFEPKEHAQMASGEKIIDKKVS